MKCIDKSRANEETARKYGYTPREWERLNAEDSQERRKQIRLGLIAFFLLAVAAVLAFFVYYVAWRSHDFELSIPFDRTNVVYSGAVSSSFDETAEPFSAGLCVADSDTGLSKAEIGALSAGLFDLTEQNVIYGKDLFTTRSPASMTKIMTAVVAMKYGNMDDQVTITKTALDVEYGSSVCDVKVGDVLSLKQLVYGMMVASGNDAAMMIAEHVGGSVQAFVDLMNREALSAGATRTHFMNPHGLTAENHYTCAYDLYLMFREAMNYDMFMDMISRKNYYAEYRNSEGNAVAVTWESTNHYLTGDAYGPDHVILYGGKTGTTEDAGACLALLSKDLYGNPYFSVIMHSQDKDTLYEDMNQLLSLIPDADHPA